MSLRLKQTTLLFIILLSASVGMTQEVEKIDIPNLTLPSPTAHKLGNYGQNNIGTFSGTQQLSVPVFNYNARNIKIPISLGYSSNGIPVNQVSTDVGLGWTLNVGGVISRIVRDKSDEQRDYFFPEEELSEVGYASPLAHDFYYLGGNSDVDTETDLYSFHFLNYSGKFLKDNDHKIVQVPKTNLKIENYYEGVKTGFKITDPSGISYVFLEEEITVSRVSGSGHSIPELPVTTAWYLTRIEAPSGVEVYFTYEDNTYSYVASQSQTLQVSNPGTQYICNGSTVSGYSVIPGDGVTPLSTHLNHVGYRLSQISSNVPSAGTVQFQSTELHPELNFPMVTDVVLKSETGITKKHAYLYYQFTANSRVFLNSMAFLDKTKKYTFDYISPELFPERLSYSQDHWGYYNGKINNYLFPNPQTLTYSHAALSEINIGADKNPDPVYTEIGLLSSVTYPTKGKTEFVYEPNDFRGTKIIYPQDERGTLGVDTEQGDMGANMDTYNFASQMNQEASVNLSAYFNDYACEEFSDVGKSQANFAIYNITDSQYLELYQKSAQGSPIVLGTGYNVGPDASAEIYAGLKEDKSYRVELTVNFECIRAGATIHYLVGTPTEEDTNVLSGGVRVKSLLNRDENGQIATYKRFYYSQKEQIGISSGVEGQKPYYLDHVTQRINCMPAETNFTDVYYVNINTNSLRKLFNTQGVSSTTYQYVTESFGGDNFEQGGIEHVYNIASDVKAKSIWGDVINGAPYMNTGWKNGLEEEKLVFKKNSMDQIQPIEKTEFNYIADQRDYDEVNGYVIKKGYELTNYGDVTLECTEKEVNASWVRRWCAADHDHVHGNLPFDGTSDWVCVKFNADNRSETIYHPCKNAGIGAIITYPRYIENLDIMEYKTLSYWYYMNSQTVTKYDESGEPVILSTEYQYDNPVHKLVTQTKQENSKNESTILLKLYPDDITDLNTLSKESLNQVDFDVITQMQTQNDHIIGVPIQVEQLTENELFEVMSSSYQRNTYEYVLDQPVIKSVSAAKGSSSLEDRINFHRYDSSGNLLEVSKPEGTSVIYIWGYDDQFPIAKIENATYAEIASSLGENISTLEDNVDEANLGQINGLRLSLSNALVTTYTYEPLVGIKTITDSKGYTKSYEYDDLNRLKFIKDHIGNLLKEFKYNYKSN